MKATKSFVGLLFLLFVFIENRSITDAWTTPPSSWLTKYLARLSIERYHRTPRMLWENQSCQIQFKIHGSARRRCKSHLPSYSQSDDDDENHSVDAEEEAFYREYESMYSPKEPTNTKTENSNRKVEVAKAWDEGLLQQNTRTPDISEGERRLSSLSDLQETLQQIQKRNSEGPIQGYSAQDSDSDSDSDSDTLQFLEEKEGNTMDAKGQKQQVANESLMTNEQYLQILQKAQERLSRLTDSNLDPKIFQKTEKKTLVSNMSSLQQRLNQIQRDASAATEGSDGEEPPPPPKFLDDATLAEWEELDNQLQREGVNQLSPSSIQQASATDDMLPDEAAILDALRSQAAVNRSDPDEDDDMDVDADSSNTIYNTIDGNDSVDPNTIPTEYKKFVSDYEITDDGGIFLSAEAYLDASKNANPDGSLNFGLGDSDNDPQQLSTLESMFMDDEPPMAPYSSKNDTGSSKKEVVSIQDLMEEASRSLEFARNNPEAQEELHRRLMAEFEADEPTNDAFESELLLDPEKALAFWNQQHVEERKVEVDALEDLLDQKMQELMKDQEKGMNETGNDNSKGPLGRKLDSQKQAYKADENIFFASKQERINRKRTIERNRRERAKNIARFYEESDEDSSWGSTSESKQVEEINRRQSFQKENSDDIMEETTSEIFEEEADTSIPTINKKNEGTSVDADEGEEESVDEWTFDEDPEWVFVEDPESPEDSFYWNEATSEMRRDPPDGFDP